MNESARLSAAPASPRAALPRRLRAAGVHVVVTALVFGAALGLVMRWFPGFHFWVDGGWQGLRLLLVAQLVLGPLLTLVIFNPFKARHLILFDLACIGLLQAAALAAGLFAMHGQRPLSINFHDGVFYSMPARSMAGAPQLATVLGDASAAGPVLVYVAPPASDDERKRAAARVELNLLSHEDALFFRPFAPHWADVQSAALDPTDTRDTHFARELPAFLAAQGGSAGAFRFFRYQGGYGSCIVALGAAGAVIGALACERA